MVNIYGQNQFSFSAGWGANKNNLSSHNQASLGIQYRKNQNTIGVSYNIIDFHFRYFQLNKLYYLVGGATSYYRHLNKKRLSGIYLGTSVSYTQFSEFFGQREKYNESYSGVVIENLCDEPACCIRRYKQININPVFGYEYYPLTRISVFSEVGYGILLTNIVSTKWFDGRKPTAISNETFGNFIIKVGLKTVIWRSDKNKNHG